MPDPLFTDLFRDTENVTWEPTERVRDRGRRRTRRTRVMAGLGGVVAVAVIVGGAAALAARPDGTPPAPPVTVSPSPKPSTPPSIPPSIPPSTPPSTPPSSAPSSKSPPSDPAIPAAAMLRASDLADGFTSAGSDLDGDWSLEAATIFCSNKSPQITPGEVARRGAVFGKSTVRIIERVTRHSGGNAGTAMDRVRELVSDCVPYNDEISMSVLATGLGGEESLLVASSVEGTGSRWLFVRQGDLVAQVWLGKTATTADARRYAPRVASRLCAGTDAC